MTAATRSSRPAGRRAEWTVWLDTHRPQFAPSSYRFGRKNVLADEILGVWRINGRNVELSEVTFQIGETRRYVGITWGDAVRTETGLAASFAELEALLDLAPRETPA